MTGQVEQGVVVVGVDDSDASRSALGWAAEYARSRRAKLVVLHVRRPWQDQPFAAGPGAEAMQLGVSVTADATASAQSEALTDSAAALQAMFTQLGPEPGWRLEIIDGSPGPELIRAARDADLLVVGTQEHTGLTRLLTGSVSHYCLSHAPGPVAAVPPEQPAST